MLRSIDKINAGQAVAGKFMSVENETEMINAAADLCDKDTLEYRLHQDLTSAQDAQKQGTYSVVVIQKHHPAPENLYSHWHKSNHHPSLNQSSITLQQMHNAV
jgi:hypothetical protein